MTRDITDRLDLFLMHHCGHSVDVNRIALNMNQINEYDPPPNPAKLTDSRGSAYVEKYGDESWELDALEPTVITKLITKTVEELRDQDLWDEAVSQEEKHKSRLSDIADDLEAEA